jgi:2-polyprenyl-6-methoxyphenol hydroxylase-like FAD-dependent oxidoreductase
MLLARRGYDVVVVDKTTFPSDTMSTHVLHPMGAAALDRWGLLERLTASGCPPIDTYVFDFGPLVLSGAPGIPSSPFAYCPRRTVLDTVLVDGAREAGAEVLEGFTVAELERHGGTVVGLRGTEADGTSTTVRARVVVGADGGHSLVARSVAPASYNERPKLLCAYYSYWSGLPMNGRFEVYARDRRGFAAAPTNDDLTMLVGGWPFAEREANQHDIEGTWMGIFDQAPEFKERLQGAHRESPLVGTAVPNRFRVPYGPGWALVGDAGYERDFITAQGITDAFRDAELCSTALDEALSGQRPFDEAMADYQATRDAQVLPMYELTQQIASMEPPPPELAQVLDAAQGNQEAMDGFAQVNAGTLSPVAYFSEENVGRIFAAAGAAG